MHFTGVSRVVSHSKASPNRKSVQASFDLFNRRRKALVMSKKAYLRLSHTLSLLVNLIVSMSLRSVH